MTWANLKNLMKVLAKTDILVDVFTDLLLIISVDNWINKTTSERYTQFSALVSDCSIKYFRVEVFRLFFTFKVSGGVYVLKFK